MKKVIFILGLLVLNSCAQNTKSQKADQQGEKKVMEERETVDINKLTDTDKQFLNQFDTRRKLFNQYLIENKIEKHTCPGCGYPTLEARGEYEICEICNWEDDGQDDKEANQIWGGPNHGLTLTENRINIGKTLNAIADSLQGTINTDPDEVMNVFPAHDKRMNSLDEEKLMNALSSDPIWKKWEELSKVILTDLIKK